MAQSAYEQGGHVHQHDAFDCGNHCGSCLNDRALRGFMGEGTATFLVVASADLMLGAQDSLFGHQISIVEPEPPEATDKGYGGSL